MRWILVTLLLPVCLFGAQQDNKPSVKTNISITPYRPAEVEPVVEGLWSHKTDPDVVLYRVGDQQFSLIDAVDYFKRRGVDEDAIKAVLHLRDSDDPAFDGVVVVVKRTVHTTRIDLPPGNQCGWSTTVMVVTTTRHLSLVRALLDEEVKQAKDEAKVKLNEQLASQASSTPAK